MSGASRAGSSFDLGQLNGEDGLYVTTKGGAQFSFKRAQDFGLNPGFAQVTVDGAYRNSSTTWVTRFVAAGAPLAIFENSLIHPTFMTPPVVLTEFKGARVL